MALIDFIKDWKGKEVLIIGEALVDKYIFTSYSNTCISTTIN